jgi:hypothetical protein
MHQSSLWRTLPASAAPAAAAGEEVRGMQTAGVETCEWERDEHSANGVARRRRRRHTFMA